MKKDFKSGFVTLIGRPNVGKSTLMNYLIGQKIAITSNKPQTTRNRIQTVLTLDDGQIVFVDTPGIHKAKNKLGEYMVNVAEKTLNEVDVVLWLVEPSTFIGAGEKHIAERLRKVSTPVILVINKVDMVKREEIAEAITAYKDIYDFAEIVPVSARNGDNTDELMSVVMKYLPYGPQFYDEDTVTDQPERQIVAELIREKALHSLNDRVEIEEEEIYRQLEQLNRENDILLRFNHINSMFKYICDMVKAVNKESSSRQMEEIEQYICDHYMDSDMGLTKISDDFGYASTYFSKLFKELFGENFATYLEKMRIEKVCGLLKKGYTMEKIAEQTGYNSVYVMRTAFKRIKGMPPNEFRKLNEEETE